MPLNLEQPGHHLFIRAISVNGVQIVDTWVHNSFILTPERVDDRWPVDHVDQLTHEMLNKLLEQKPELVILGTGRQQIFPPAGLLAPFFHQGVGIEMMNTEAACRTFNICVSENRRVVSGMIIETA